MRFITFCILIFAAATVATAQSGSGSVRSKDALKSLQEKEMTGNVVLQLDTLIFENYQKLLVQNSKLRGVDGYRIRIFSDNGHGAKENQRRVRARFLSSHPGIPTYGPYEGSYYKIYVGDFRTKRDALKYLDDIQRGFPDAFIVESNIVIED